MTRPSVGDILACIASHTRKRSGLLAALTFTILLVLLITLYTNIFYTVPYRDMTIGIYPPSRITDLLLSPWSPENFGQPASIPMLYIVLYFFEKILPPVKAFILYTLFPYIVATTVAYYVLREQLGIRDEALLAALSILASINWFTLYSYGSVYVIYTYIGGLLALGTLYRIYSRTDLDSRVLVLELVLSMLLSVAGWNLPGLLLLYILLLANLPLLWVAGRRRLLYALRYIIVSTVIVLIIASPFLYAKIFGIVYFGFKNYIVKAGYVPIGHSWIKILMPYYFKKYLGSLLKIYMLPFDPLLETPAYLLAAVVVPLLIAYTLVRIGTIRNNKLKIFYIYQIIYVLVISLLVFLISDKNNIINILYSNISFITVLKTVTNYMVILLPSVLLTIYISIIFFIKRKIQYIIAVLFLVLALSSNKLLIVQLVKVNDVDMLHIGGYDYKIFKINKNIIKIFNKMNIVKGWCRRAIWMPLYPQERSMLVSMFEDIPISKATNAMIARHIDVMLTNLLKANSTLYTQNITEVLMDMYGIQYIVVLKNVKDDEAPRIVYYGVSPVGVVGSYKKIITALNSKPYLKLIYNDSTVAIFKFNNNVSIFNIFKFNNKEYQYFINVNIDNSTSIKETRTSPIVLEKGENIVLNVTTHQGRLRKFMIDVVLKYNKSYNLYGNIIKIFNSIRVLIRRNGQLLVQLRTDKGIVNYFSKKVINPGIYHHIIVSFNNGVLNIFIDGMFDGMLRVAANNIIVDKNNKKIIIGSADNYNISLIVKHVQVDIGNVKLPLVQLTEQTLQILGINGTITPLEAACRDFQACSVNTSMTVQGMRTHTGSDIIVSSNLEPFWRVDKGATAYRLSPVLDSFTKIYVRNPKGMLVLGIIPAFLLLKISLLVAFVIGVMLLLLYMVGFVKDRSRNCYFKRG